MNLYDAESERCIRFYHWAKARLLREIENGDPSYFAVNNMTVFSLRKWLDTISEDRRKNILLLLLERAHPVARELLGLPEIETQARRMLSEWNTFDEMMGNRYFFDSGIYDYVEQGKVPRKTDVRKHFTAVLSDYFGSKPRKEPGLDGEWTVTVGDWSIDTRLIVTSSVAPTAYCDFIVMRLDMPYGAILPPFSRGNLIYTRDPSQGRTSLCSWYGISPEDSFCWSEEEMQRCASMFLESCSTFMDAMRSQLMDLTIE